MGRKYARSQRTLDWRQGLVNDVSFVNAGIGIPGTQIDNNILTPITQGEYITVTRIVGNIQVFPDWTDTIAVGATALFVNMGVQLVNRAKNLVGTSRSPALPDDREGREWMWLKTVMLAYTITGGADTPPDWLLPACVEGGDGVVPVDIRVQRKLDDSQDELLLSLSAQSISVGAAANPDVIVTSNLRCLVRNS